NSPPVITTSPSVITNSPSVITNSPSVITNSPSAITNSASVTLAGRVLAAMTDNDNFPDPMPSLAELEPLVNTYRSRHEIASRRGSALEISQKNESRQQLLEAFKQLAFYINTVSDG